MDFYRKYGETKSQPAGILKYVKDVDEGSTPSSGEKTFVDGFYYFGEWFSRISPFEAGIKISALNSR